MTRSALATPIRMAWISSAVRATRIWHATAPPFCARPVMSMLPKPLPSMKAAWPSTALIVTTPVPPTPVTSIEYGPVRSGCLGSGRLDDNCSKSPLPAAPFDFFTLAPCSVTKLGQKPSRHEKSLLQEDWSIARLRPSSVSSGMTDTQFDFLPQSPQPSQTAGLMKTRLSGSGKSPRLRRRRFSAAQVWS